MENIQSVRMELPINFSGDRNEINEIFYGAKCYLQDVEPLLTSQQLMQIYEIIGAVISDAKKEFEVRLTAHEDSGDK